MKRENFPGRPIEPSHHHHQSRSEPGRTHIHAGSPQSESDKIINPASLARGGASHSYHLTPRLIEFKRDKLPRCAVVVHSTQHSQLGLECIHYTDFFNDCCCFIRFIVALIEREKALDTNLSRLMSDRGGGAWIDKLPSYGTCELGVTLCFL